MTHEEILGKLRERFGADGFQTSEFRDNRRILLAPDRLYAVLEFLKGPCGFDMLAELGGADYLQYPGAKDRFGVWYVLVTPITRAGRPSSSSRALRGVTVDHVVCGWKP